MAEGGFGAGNGSAVGRGGAGDSLGGAIFVRQGGRLTITVDRVKVTSGNIVKDATSGSGNPTRKGQDLYLMSGVDVDIAVRAGLGEAELTGSIAGAGAITKSGGGTLFLDGTNSYEGGTKVTLGRLAGHSAGVEWVTFTRDGRLLGSASADRSARIWDPTTGKVKAVLKGHTGVVHVAAFAGGGRAFVTAGADGTVRFWDPTTGKATFVVKAHTASILALAISPDSRLMATGGHDNVVKLWTLTAKR